MLIYSYKLCFFVCFCLVLASLMKLCLCLFSERFDYYCESQMIFKVLFVLGKKRVELLFVIVVIQEIVQIHTGLHGIDHIALVAVI